jgi:hypothetical protein
MEMNSGAPGGYVVLAPLVAIETQEWNVVQQWEKKKISQHPLFIYPNLSILFR